MVFNPKMPYDDLPLLPPKADVETKTVLKQALAATRALGELKGAGGIIPNQAILINAIPLQEAKLSSDIENIVTTQDDLYHAKINLSGAVDPNTKEVLRYCTALRKGYDELARGKKISLELITDICSTILDQRISFRASREVVRVGIKATGAVHYTPPTGGKPLLNKLRNLESFLTQNSDLDPLVRMAIAHYQFQAIHPFMDGNGRTGRIINILYLVQTGLLQIPVLYLSRFIIQNKSKYYQLLPSVTERGDWEPWLVYMLRGIEETAHWTTNRIHAIHELFDKAVERCKRDLPKIYSKELIELIFSQPYCKISFVVEAGIAKRQTAGVYLQELEKTGILVGEMHGREMVYKHPALIEVLKA